MEIHTLSWALIFVCLTAAIGLYMLTRVFRRLPRQTGVMIVHGIFAAAGVGLLVYYSGEEPNSEIPFPSVFFFIIAIFAGMVMVFWDKIMNRKMPRYFPLFHAGAAVTGIILLVFFLLHHS